MLTLQTRVRELRQRSGQKLQDLARRVGISRQSLGAIEAGSAVPSTLVALELARALGCRVEDLFVVSGSETPLSARFASDLGSMPEVGDRVRLGLVSGQWVAHGFNEDEGTIPADAVASGRAEVTPLRDETALRANLIVAGCDPALGLLAGHLMDAADRVRVHWLSAASGTALEALARDEVHIAGLHLYDVASGEHNVPAVRARLGGRPVLLVNLAAWETGFVVGSGHRVRSPGDLRAPRLRVVGREAGAAAQSLLERVASKAGAKLKIVETARSHFGVARSVASGRADVGMATAAAAKAYGLRFVPLSEDRFDLAMPADTAASASGQRLLDTLASGRFRRELGALPGYQTQRTGQVLARLAA